MKPPSRFVLTLNSNYPKNHSDFYRSLLTSATTVAVDGGLKLFRMLGISPNVLIGDLDSVGRLPRRLLAKTDIIQYPREKDKTDSQLALEYAIGAGARQIDIVMPFTGEADHFVGNLLLLAGQHKRNRAAVRIVCHTGEYRFLRHERLSIRNGIGTRFSIFPMSSIVQVTLQGAAYPADALRLKRGDSGGMRNEITAAVAAITIKGGAIVYRRYPRSGSDSATLKLSQLSSDHS